MENCENCGTPLNGAYCSACGQRVLHHGLSLGEFLKDAAEVITHADSRFWSTFVPLLVRPGFLTQQFIQGRRASYLPPFRLYLVLSVVFFLLIPLTSNAPDGPGKTPVHVSTPAEIRAALQKEIDAAKDPEDKAELQQQLLRYDTITTKLVPSLAGKRVDCNAIVDAGSFRPWLHGRLITACDRIQSDHGRELGLNLLHNLGRAMFVLLPLLAALMLLLYQGQGRYYVEHLLLLLHNHAFVFLALSVLMISGRLIPSDTWAGWFGTGMALYMIFYLYRSMRRVYGQGRFRTFLKFCALSVAYLVCATLMFVLTTIYSAIML
jgi:hypothetical protein